MSKRHIVLVGAAFCFALMTPARSIGPTGYYLSTGFNVLDVANDTSGAILSNNPNPPTGSGLGGTNAQERGILFIGAGEKVYAGMVIGQSGKPEDIELNVCKKKQLTNTRSSGADEALRLSPPKILSLEQALEFIDSDELLEITPESLRIRKKILDPPLRKRSQFNKSQN